MRRGWLIVGAFFGLWAWPIFSMSAVSKDRRIIKPSLKVLHQVSGSGEKRPFSQPQGIYFSKAQDKLYVADTDNQNIALFSGTGESLGSFTSSQPLARPTAVVVDEKGRVYISQQDKKAIEVFSSQGAYLHSIPSPDLPKKEEFFPGRFLINLANGRLYAVNRKTAEIWVFEKDGSLAFSFGGRGLTEGKFQFITDLVLHEHKLYVTDAQGIPVQIFNLDGRHLLSFGKHGQNKEDFSFPRAVAIDTQNRIWVVDAFRHCLNVFSQQGTFLFQVGSYGGKPGNFCFPIDLALGEREYIYVLEKGSNRFQILKIEEEGESVLE